MPTYRGYKPAAVRSASEHSVASLILLLICFLSMYVRSKQDSHPARWAQHIRSSLGFSLPPLT